MILILFLFISINLGTIPGKYSWISPDIRQICGWITLFFASYQLGVVGHNFYQWFSSKIKD
jgi:hypothetical protein